MNGQELAPADGTQGNLVPIRVPGTNDIIWVPPMYVEQAEAAVSQMMRMNRGPGGAGALGTFADIAEAVTDFFGQEQIQRHVDAAHRARARVLQTRKAFRDKLSDAATRQTFMDWQDAQDEQDQAQTAALENSVTLLRVSALAAAGRGIGRIFNGGMQMSPGSGNFSWGAAVAGGVAGFGLAEIFTNNRADREYRPPRDNWA